jgi:hypothetical protein
MKGTIFLKNLEYNLFADGEKWNQGSKIKGHLKIKNHASEKVELDQIKISLSVGNFKKIKAKNTKAWECITELNISNKISFAPMEEKEFPWEFLLPEDCQVTDKDNSIFLTFEDQNINWPTAQLELVIDPKPVIDQLLEIFKSFLRFKIIQTKFSKGMVEIKLNPPSSKELNHVESLILRIKEVNETLDIHYTFNMHAFEMVAGNMMTQKKIKQVEQKLLSKQYYEFGNSLKQDYIIATISDVIKEATPKFYL